MLTLQRASAGSGKTYTLAKKFIWYLITTPDGNGGFRLRHTKELPESLRSILAVTFTNKATNEMKNRIVRRLSDLSKATAVDGADYMKDFCETLGVAPEEIAEVCGEALRVSLNNYSDFNISTIDSFFQRVLRTFAYETDLGDNYQLELDNDYVATVGVDSALESFDASDRDNNETRFWLEYIVRERFLKHNNPNWNPFVKSGKGNSLYSELYKAVKCLDKESFKEIKGEIDEYLADATGLREFFLRMERTYREKLDGIVERTRGFARDYLAGIDRLMVADVVKKDTVKVADKILTKDVKEWGKINLKKGKGVFNKPKNKRQISLIESAQGEIESLYEIMADSFEEIFTDPWITHWGAYRETFPYLGLVQQVRQEIAEYLRTNNIVELGETNSILSRIIGEEDTPFIYERIGTYIDHFLIDEFQDTSRLQWENMYPLLKESVANGHENLIIGDAKQSIYRFRNADPMLITSVVESAFGDDCIPCGMSQSENTNHRSRRNIVEFNNFISHHLAARLKDDVDGALDYNNIYANTSQCPRFKSPEGYVEINFVESCPSSGSDSESPEKIAYYRKYGELVHEYLSRGYKQSDIAFLVWRNEEGVALINGLIDYNESLGDDEELIQFVSSQSLLVSGASSVKTIISVLEAINAGTKVEFRTGDDAVRRGAADWRDIGCNFNFFIHSHPELSRAQQVVEFLKNPVQDDTIADMLSNMQTVALPALVEGIVNTFVDEKMRNSEAAFIAAFQDLVVEFCEGPATDTAAFLRWWREKGVVKSIASPDGMDAVNIMTVHKSKGLEFPVVILPYASVKFKVNESGWTWVKPYPLAENMPPYLPVQTRDTLLNTIHAPLYLESRDLDILDTLNSVYVAFTRAIDELVVFLPQSTRKVEDSLCENIRDILTSRGKLLGEQWSGSEYTTLCQNIIEVDENRYILGEHGPFDQGKKGVTDEESNFNLISEYRVSPAVSLLAYHGKHEPNPAVIDTLFGDIPEDEEDDPALVKMELLEESDPRAVGTLLHRVLENTERLEDLARAIKIMRLDGEISREDAESMDKMLRGAIESTPLTSGWFDGSRKVFTERSLLSPKTGMKRPDRIMVDKDGVATVVDYKFGTPRLARRHCRHVKEYMHLLKETGLFTRIEGYVWYLREGEIIPLDPL